jgi:hypothetical protein
MYPQLKTLPPTTIIKALRDIAVVTVIKEGIMNSLRSAATKAPEDQYLNMRGCLKKGGDPLLGKRPWPLSETYREKLSER